MGWALETTVVFLVCQLKVQRWNQSLTNFSILTKVFIYLDMFLRVDDEFACVCLSENFEVSFPFQFSLEFKIFISNDAH